VHALVATDPRGRQALHAGDERLADAVEVRDLRPGTEPGHVGGRGEHRGGLVDRDVDRRPRRRGTSHDGNLASGRCRDGLLLLRGLVLLGRLVSTISASTTSSTSGRVSAARAAWARSARSAATCSRVPCSALAAVAKSARAIRRFSFSSSRSASGTSLKSAASVSAASMAAARASSSRTARSSGISNGTAASVGRAGTGGCSCPATPGGALLLGPSCTGVRPGDKGCCHSGATPGRTLVRPKEGFALPWRDDSH
jgi:hypothetical protein